LEPLAPPITRHGIEEVSIRRADQGALERRAPQRRIARCDGFNPPGGSGSLGTRSDRPSSYAASAVSIRRADQGALELGPYRAGDGTGLVSIRRADQGASEPPQTARCSAPYLTFQSAGRIREPWNLDHTAILQRKYPVSIRRADQGALEHRVQCSNLVGFWVSIRRADQGALELNRRLKRKDRRGCFNPPGGSGSLGTAVSTLPLCVAVNGFNPPGGSGSLGTRGVWKASPARDKFQSAGRIREPWNYLLVK